MQRIDTGEKRKRRREFIIIITIICLVSFLTLFEAKYSEFSDTVPFAHSFLIYAIININVLFLLFLFFLVTRNFIKLFFERKQNVLGSKLKSKLVIAFVSLSFLPTVILFVISSGFITKSIESWFSKPVENSLEEAIKLAKTYYSETLDNLENQTRLIRQELVRDKFFIPLSGDKISSRIDSLTQFVDFSGMRIITEKNQSIINIKKEDYEPQPIEEDNIRDAIANGISRQIIPYGNVELMRVVIPFENNNLKYFLILEKKIDENLVKKLSSVAKNYEEYKQTKILKQPIKMGYKIILLTTALLIVLVSSWFGFYLAKTITVPIQKLAEATIRVADGDLNSKIQKETDDEIGILVDSFNKMTDDLRIKREGLERANLLLRKINEELDQRRKYMEIILNNAATGVVAVDSEGRITIINKAAEGILDINAERIMFRNYRDVLEQRYIDLIDDIIREMQLSGQESMERQIKVIIKNKVVILMLHVSILKDEAGRYMGIVGVFDDMTKLIKAQRMAAWREVARRMAHEIKNPLTPIKLSAQRLSKKFGEKIHEDGAVFYECIDTIIKQVDELKNLVDEFSQFARMPAINPKPNDINEIIREAVLLYSEAHKHISFEFYPSADIPVFEVDRDQIKRAIINLLDNAVEAVEVDGRIVVSTQYEKGSKIARIEIADNGCGIADEDKLRLFEPYFSKKKHGTGLGLAIVNTIISDHNGYIRVCDNIPKGTRFIIELPIKNEG